MSKLQDDKKSVCLIGLGNVGYGKYLHKNGGKVLDHYSAIRNSQFLEIRRAIDQKIPSELASIGKKSIAELEDNEYNLVVVASNTQNHLEIIEELMRIAHTDVILLEKPGTSSLAEFLKLERMMKDKDSNLFVNYQRNYNPNIMEKLLDNKLGQIQCGVVHYSNGALNNASHALAIVLKLLKDDVLVSRLNESPGDIHADLNFELVNSSGCRIVFLATNEKNYSNFRIEMDYENGVVFYDSASSFIETKFRVPDPNFLGRYCLSEKAIKSETKEHIGFIYVYDFIVNELANVRNAEYLGVDSSLARQIHIILDTIQNG